MKKDGCKNGEYMVHDECLAISQIREKYGRYYTKNDAKYILGVLHKHGIKASLTGSLEKKDISLNDIDIRITCGILTENDTEEKIKSKLDGCADRMKNIPGFTLKPSSFLSPAIIYDENGLISSMVMIKKKGRKDLLCDLFFTLEEQ